MSEMKLDGESVDGGSHGSVEENSTVDWDGSCLAPKDYVTSAAKEALKSKFKEAGGRWRRQHDRFMRNDINSHIFSSDANIDEWDGEDEEEVWEGDDEDDEEGEWEGDDDEEEEGEEDGEEEEEDEGQDAHEEEEFENTEMKDNNKNDMKQNENANNSEIEGVKMAIVNTNGFETLAKKEDTKTFENNETSETLKLKDSKIEKNGETSIPTEQNNKKDKEKVEDKLAIVQNIFEYVHIAVRRYGEGDLALACLSNIIASDLQVNGASFPLALFVCLIV